jgi:hypothetical protein
MTGKGKGIRKPALNHHKTDHFVFWYLASSYNLTHYALLPDPEIDTGFRHLFFLQTSRGARKGFEFGKQRDGLSGHGR